MSQDIYISVQPVTGEDVYVNVSPNLAGVLFVNGRDGIVVLNKSDVGLSNVENVSITGASGYLQNQINNLDLNYASDLQLSQTGSNLQQQINNLYGSGFITGVDLSHLYPRSNPSGFITGVNLSNYATVSSLELTGSNLQNQINNLSGYGNSNFYPNTNPSGFITNKNVVFTTGDQTIIGLKNFTGINSTGARSLQYNSTDVLIEGDAVPAQKYISINPFTTGTYNPYYQLSGATYLNAISYVPTNGNILLPQNPKNNTICEIEIPNAAFNGGLNLNIFAVPGAYPTFPLASVSGNSNILGYIKFAYIDGNWRKYPTVVPHRSTHSAYGSDPIFAKDINAVPELSYYYTNKLDADVTVGGSGIYETNSQLNGKSYWTCPIGNPNPVFKIYWNNTNNSWEIGLGPGSIVFVRSFNNVPEPYIATGWQSANYGATLRSIRRLPYVDITNQQIKGDFLIDNVYAQNLVYHSGNQTISGVKNFISRPTVNGTGVLLSSEAYPSNNPSGFLTGIDLSSYATISNLATTGSTLTTQINNLSGVSVLTYGNQTIDGIKTFRNSVYIHDLYVTGTEFIANVQNNFIESPYILLNLTGGSTDGGIFFVTGSGLTGVNDYGPILGFDHTSKFKFGVARRSDDLSVLNDIASVQDITNYSGFVNSNFYGINNPNGYITGIENIVYITGDQLVSGLKTFSDNINTNQIKGITGQFIGNSLSLIGGDGTSFGGPVIIRGGTGVNAGGNIQLNSNVSANRGTNKSLGIQAFRSGQVGEASIDIDDTIFNVKNGLTFQISGETVDPLNYYTKDNPSGFITGIDTSNFYTNNNPSGYITNANVVYTTGDQTIGGLKTFSSGISVTGGTINLAGKDVVGITNAYGESVIIRGGSGVGDGSAFSFANGGNITLIGGTALSGGFPPVTPGNVTIIGGSGGNLPTFAPLPETIGSINLYGGARISDNRGGSIIAHGNIYINPDPIKSREFIIYKSGIGALGAADNLVVRQNSINVNNLLTVSGNPVLTGVNLSNYATTGQLSQTSGTLQSQIDILNVNSIAYAIALG
jgi:hypothetical protein